jgi:hypothetical protein
MCWLQESRSRSSKRIEQAAAEAVPDRGNHQVLIIPARPDIMRSPTSLTSQPGRRFGAVALHNRALRIMRKR